MLRGGCCWPCRPRHQQLLNPSTPQHPTEEDAGEHNIQQEPLSSSAFRQSILSALGRKGSDTYSWISCLDVLHASVREVCSVQVRLFGVGYDKHGRASFLPVTSSDCWLSSFAQTSEVQSLLLLAVNLKTPVCVPCTPYDRPADGQGNGYPTPHRSSPRSPGSYAHPRYMAAVPLLPAVDDRHRSGLGLAASASVTDSQLQPLLVMLLEQDTRADGAAMQRLDAAPGPTATPQQPPPSPPPLPQKQKQPRRGSKPMIQSGAGSTPRGPARQLLGNTQRLEQLGQILTVWLLGGDVSAVQWLVSVLHRLHGSETMAELVWELSAVLVEHVRRQFGLQRVQCRVALVPGREAEVGLLLNCLEKAEAVPAGCAVGWSLPARTGALSLPPSGSPPRAAPGPAAGGPAAQAALQETAARESTLPAGAATVAKDTSGSETLDTKSWDSPGLMTGGGLQPHHNLKAPAPAAPTSARANRVVADDTAHEAAASPTRIAQRSVPARGPSGLTPRTLSAAAGAGGALVQRGGSSAQLPRSRSVVVPLEAAKVTSAAAAEASQVSLSKSAGAGGASPAGLQAVAFPLKDTLLRSVLRQEQQERERKREQQKQQQQHLQQRQQQQREAQGNGAALPAGSLADKAPGAVAAPTTAARAQATMAAFLASMPTSSGPPPPLPPPPPLAGSSGVFGDASAYDSRLVEDVQKHLQDIDLPAGDVLMLLKGQKSAAAGPAAGRVAALAVHGAGGSRGGFVRGDNARSVAAAPPPAGPQSLALVTLPVPDGVSGEAAATFALYLCFPSTLPLELLAGVRASCQELVDKALASVIRDKLRIDLAEEYDTLRSAVPGVYGVLCSPDPAGSALEVSNLEPALEDLRGATTGSHSAGAPRVISTLGTSSKYMLAGTDLEDGRRGSATASRSGLIANIQSAVRKGFRSVSSSTRYLTATGVAADPTVLDHISRSTTGPLGGAAHSLPGAIGSAKSGGGGLARRLSWLMRPGLAGGMTASTSRAAGLSAVSGDTATETGGSTKVRGVAGNGRGDTGGGSAPGHPQASSEPQSSTAPAPAAAAVAAAEAPPAPAPQVAPQAAPLQASSLITVTAPEDPHDVVRQHLVLLAGNLPATSSMPTSMGTGSLEDLASLELVQPAGHGGAGVVYQGTWNSSMDVAVKLMELPDPSYMAPPAAQAAAAAVLPSQANGSAATASAAVFLDATDGKESPSAAASSWKLQAQKLRREALRVGRERAILVNVSHPNIVQVYFTFDNIRLRRLPSGRLQILPAFSRDEAPTAAMRSAAAAASCAANETAAVAEDDYCAPLAAVVFEWADLGSLQDALATGVFNLPCGLPYGDRPPDQDPLDLLWDMQAVCMTLLDVALGLRHLHSMNLAHRDVKPANLLLRSNPRDLRGYTVKLADFGFVLQLTRVAEDGTRYELLDQPCGTVSHMAPESFYAGSRVTTAADIFAFGVLMWEMLEGGTRPFPRLDPSRIPTMVTAGARPLFCAYTPRWYSDLAEQCWCPNPRHRPTAAELVVKLGRELRKF